MAIYHECISGHLGHTTEQAAELCDREVTTRRGRHVKRQQAERAVLDAAMAWSKRWWDDECEKALSDACATLAALGEE